MAGEKKERLDETLLRRGLAPDLKKARALVMAGDVWVDGRKADKADAKVAAGQAVGIRARSPFVSRGALKIAAAVEALAIRPAGMKILDLGISTGGFSDFFLQRGAAQVLGVDVTVSQVDGRLRRDPRLRLLEKNARFLARADVPFEPDLVVMDLSFISITAVLPVLRPFARARILALVKPQFEAPRGRVGRGGVVRDAGARREVLLGLKRRIEQLDFAVLGWCPAGVRGRRGNQEYFFLLGQGKTFSIDDKMIADGETV